MKDMNCQLRALVKRRGVVILLLLSAVFAHGQSYEQADSTVVTDTAVAISPDAEADDEDENDGQETEYFIPHWSPGNHLDSFQLREAAGGASFKDDDDFWYANAVFKKEEKESNSSRGFINTKAFEVILWLCVVGGFVAVLIIYLSNNNASLFRSSKKIMGDQADTDPETDDIFNINYEKEINKAVNAGNYRLAVRLHFLQLLRNLSSKNIIQYAQDRTNFDYILQVQQASWYPLFFRLTRNYEYAWYGHFDIDQYKFDAIRKDFTELQKQLPS